MFMVMWGFLLLYAPYHAGRGDNAVLLSDGMNEERGYTTNIEWHLCQMLFGLSRWISGGSGGYEKNNNQTSVSNGRICHCQHKGAEKNDGTPSNNSEGNDEEDEDDTTINSRR